jgi:hypothetical protein
MGLDLVVVEPAFEVAADSVSRLGEDDGSRGLEGGWPVDGATRFFFGAVVGSGGSLGAGS